MFVAVWHHHTWFTQVSIPQGEESADRKMLPPACSVTSFPGSFFRERIACKNWTGVWQAKPHGAHTNCVTVCSYLFLFTGNAYPSKPKIDAWGQLNITKKNIKYKSTTMAISLGRVSWDTLLKWRPVNVIWKILLPRPPPPLYMLKLGFEIGDWSSTLFGEVGGGVEIVIKLVKDFLLHWRLHFLTSHWNITKCPKV